MFRRVGTLFCQNPEWYGGNDEVEKNGVDDMMVRQAEGARAGGKKLSSLERWGDMRVCAIKRARLAAKLHGERPSTRSFDVRGLRDNGFTP